MNVVHQLNNSINFKDVEWLVAEEYITSDNIIVLFGSKELV